MSIQLSIIIPTYNEIQFGFLREILTVTRGLPNCEVVLVDGGSQDGSLELAREFGIQPIHLFNSNRAQRLNVGAKQAKGKLLFFQHPRSLVPREAYEFLASHSDDLRWGALTHAFDHSHFLLKFTSWYSNFVRGDLRSIYYLDHCLFASKALFSDGELPFPEVPIFEDTLFCQQLRKKMPPQRLNYVVWTSSIRFTKNGIFRQAFLNQMMKIGFYFKISKSKLDRIYEKGIHLNSKS